MTNAPAIQTDTAPNSLASLQEFYETHKRLPRLGDDRDPWTYRGWLLPYLELCEVHPQIAPRYGYLSRTLEAGKLLDEPIPQCRFFAERDEATRPGMKMLEDVVKLAEQSGRYSNGIEVVCRWLGWALGITNEETDLPRSINEQMYRTFDISKWLLAPTDYIGEYMAASNIGRGASFFPTPMAICTMMAQMTYGDGDHRTTTVNDPCVGTGRTLLAASNYSLRLTGQDILAICVLACQINFAIFAPWHHIPQSFFPVTQMSDRDVQPVSPEKLAESEPERQISAKIEQPTLFALR